MKFTHFIGFFAAILFANILAGQATDILHLRSGITVPGTIISFSSNEKVVLKKAEDGIIQTYPIEAVWRIQQLPTGDKVEDWWVLLPEVENADILSTIELNDGTDHNGTITEYQRGEHLKLKLENGSTYTFSESEIKGITYDLPEPEQERLRTAGRERNLTYDRKKAVYDFRETGWFQSTSFAFSFGKRERENLIFFTPDFEESTSTQSAIGFNVQHLVGYQFSRLAGVGLGLSYDAYDLEDGESIFTVFGHYRAYLSKRIVAPYVAVSGGYGFALQNENQGVTQADGGWMFHPEAGLRLGATNKANFTVSVGYRLQDAYYVQERPFSGNIEYRDVRYQRFLFSLGLLF